jgi:stringent starvation protein B
MKKFNEFMEAVLIAKVIPTGDSDAVAPVSPCGCEDKPKDQFSSATDDFMKQMGFEDDQGAQPDDGMVQPTDGVGEAGEIESDSTSNVELTCLGEDGLQIKFNGLTFTLPVDVVDAIKGFSSEAQEDTGEGTEHEENESPAEETAEHAEGGSEETETEAETETEEKDEDEEKKNPFTESKKTGKAVNPWAVCNASTGGKKKDPKKFESCIMDVKKKSPIKK